MGLIALGLFLARKVRKTGLYTLPEITGQLFDDRARTIAAVLVVITEIAWVSLLIQSSGLILSVVLGIIWGSTGFYALLTVITAVFVAYTFKGGQYSVVYTDLVQFFIMLVGVCLIAAPLLWMRASPDLGGVSPLYLSFPTNARVGTIPAFSFFVIMFMPHVVGPDIYSKLLSAKDERTAARASMFSGALKLVFAAAIGIIAISALVMFPPGTDAALAENPNLALPMAVATLDPLIAGIILAAFLSVILSSSDSCLLSAGTIISVDILRKDSVKVSRLGIAGVGIAALMLSLLLNDVLQTLVLAYTVFTAGLTFPILFGFFKKRTQATSGGAFWSFVLGGSASLVWLWWMPLEIDAILVGMIFSLLPLILFRGEENER